MRKIAVITLGTLLMISNAFAGSSTMLDSKSLFQSVINKHISPSSEKGDLEMVYGGKDISRSGSAALLGLENPVYVG